MLRVSEGGDPPRRREAFVTCYRQLAHSLLDLEEAADRIFDTVSARITEEGQKLSSISERIRKAKISIDALTQSSDRLIIKSPLRYPSSCDNKGFSALFEDDSWATVLVDGGLSREFGLDGTLELYQFFSEANCAYQNDTQNELGRKYIQVLNENGENLTWKTVLPRERNSTKPKHQELPPMPPSLVKYKDRVI